MQKWFKYFVYISLIFLIIALVKGNYLVIPIIKSYTSLGAALFFVCLGFILQAKSWQLSLHQYGHQVVMKEAIISSGLAVFGKYIPGKLWVIAGRAGYIAQRYRLDLKSIINISLQTQFMTLWVSLLLGLTVSLILYPYTWWTLTIIGLWILFSLLIFTNVFYDLMSRLLWFFFKKKMDFKILKTAQLMGVLPYFFLNWFAWCIGFAFLIDALTATGFSFILGLTFSIAVSLGILALISPGGLGIREMILFFYLSGMNLSQAEITTLVASSRLWYLLGEIFIFGLALSFKYLFISKEQDTSAPSNH